MTTLYAHRGASRMCPENTMAAFRQAVREKADGIELDVQLSKDHKAVVIHDEAVDRTTNGTGEVKDLTLAELKSLDAGSWQNAACKEETIPTLEEVLAWIKGTDMKLNVELKTDVYPYEGIEQIVLEQLDRYGLKERTVISSFNPETLKRVRQLDGTIRLAVLVWDETKGMVKLAQKLKAEAIHAKKDFMFTKEAVKAAQAGIPIRLYTINDLSELDGISLSSIEGIFTDEPAKLRKELAAMLLE
ncbi:glycerophosphodiester phosphodiesterase [Jeotgalibacillus proteolyticus]|uniref:Glycerophosphodiester phosphodiesterase n=1 Tax=Jeotgalibacillus proteolyticus TaxID=2082395 RepID=A0A2S5G8X6_9BACL|nr:glycerophosphodiester phosphodiesterase [Jeotgalibacillus proteolyticus]PPA69446.1 glycerophosphodiester phosphodiesterase [Jeotgalibacillus proteolyticus]